MLEGLLRTALSCIDSGSYGQAELICREALSVAPDHGDASYLLGQVYALQDRHDEAVIPLRAAVAADPRHAPYLLALGESLHAAGEAEAALAVLERASRRLPRDGRILNGLGLAALDTGDLARAKALFKKVLRLAPETPGVALNLSRTLRFRAAETSGEPADREEATIIRAIVGIAGREDLAPEIRSDAHFALGRIRDDLGAPDLAFGHYRAGNALIHALLAREGAGFDPSRHDLAVDGLIGTFDGARLTRASNDADTRGNRSELPVLVVGMPRSGTTLVEQILSAHPDVHGAGELSIIDRISRRLGALLGTEVPYPRNVEELDPTIAVALGDEYVAALRDRGGDSLRVTDKMPENFLHLGLVAMLVPEARIIHCRRDPMDTCVSIFTQQFGAGHRWAYDQAEIGSFYLAYERIMAHWRTVLPLPMLELDYEALVSDQEAESRRLLEHCGLPWDNACLRFHESARTVTTASNWQVRQPMFQSSVGRWRRFERHLGPLLDILSPALG